jgi:myo-inositol catabolism protein IolC
VTNLSQGVAPAGHGRLADFIRANVDPIVEEWVQFARTRKPASDSMTRLALQDHIVELLEFIADDLETAKVRMNKLRNLAVYAMRMETLPAAQPKFMPHYG